MPESAKLPGAEKHIDLLSLASGGNLRQRAEPRRRASSGFRLYTLGVRPPRPKRRGQRAKCGALVPARRGALVAGSIERPVDERSLRTGAALGEHRYSPALADERRKPELQRARPVISRRAQATQ